MSLCVPEAPQNGLNRAVKEAVSDECPTVTHHR